MEFLFYKQKTTWRGLNQVVRYIEIRGCRVGLLKFNKIDNGYDYFII